MLFTSPVDAVDGALRANTDVVTEVLTTRLTDVIREQLGRVVLAVRVRVHQPAIPIRWSQTYMQITGSPDRIESVADLVVAELADLADQRPDRQRVRRRLSPRSRRRTSSSTTTRSWKR